MTDIELLHLATRESLRSYDAITGSLNNDSWLIHIDNENKITTISICGSDDLKDWISNLKIFYTTLYDGIKVHRGFGNTAKKLMQCLLIDVYRATKKGHTVLFCGHSRGGAVARLLKMLFIEADIIDDGNSKCITFGSPKVFLGNGESPDISLRVFNFDDPVTKVPYFFYSHRDSDAMKLDDEGYLDIQDHSMKHYYKMIMVDHI